MVPTGYALKKPFLEKCDVVSNTTTVGTACLILSFKQGCGSGSVLV